jgi:cysteine-rich repeat protein
MRTGFLFILWGVVAVALAVPAFPQFEADPNSGVDAPPENDSCFSPSELLDGVTAFTTVGALTDGLPHVDCDGSTGQTYADVWYTYHASCTGFLTVSTCNTVNYDSDIVIYGSGGAACDIIDCPPDTGFMLGCNDDFPGCASFSSRLTVNVVEENCYLIRIGGFDSEADQGSGTVRVGCTPPGCGNNILEDTEDCDEGEQTATCDADCTFPECGDGIHNPLAGEMCDALTNTAACDSDCTLPECGDDLINVQAGEQCDDGNTVAGDGCDTNCGIEALGPCTSPVECCDQNFDGLLDHICRWCRCEGAPGVCAIATTVLPADVGGPFTVCLPDGFCNIHDRNRCLACFAGLDNCSRVNVDAGSPFGACGPDGFCNIHDSNHALTCFAGTNPCNCGAAPEGPGVVAVDHSGFALTPDRDRIVAGQRVAVRVALDGPLDNLQSYQLHVGATGGSHGQLWLEDIEIEPRRDHVFAAVDGRFDAINVSTQQVLAGLEMPGVAVDARRYLATFTFRAGPRARGDFVIDVRADEALDDQTFLVSNFDEKIGIESSQAAVVRVESPRRSKGTTRR